MIYRKLPNFKNNRVKVMSNGFNDIETSNKLEPKTLLIKYQSNAGFIKIKFIPNKN